MSSIPNFDHRYEQETPFREQNAESKKNLVPLAEEREVPTGLENPFWKPDER